MTTKPNPIPDGYQGATPYLRCRRANDALEFYKKAFDATELSRIMMPDGRVGHAEIKISRAIVMLSDEFPEMNVVGPETIGGSSAAILIYVEDVDAFAERAAAAGAKVTTPPADQFYGDRNCKITDPFGNEWMFATHKEDVSYEEQRKRADAMFGKK
jgi:PhnB protein